MLAVIPPWFFNLFPPQSNVLTVLTLAVVAAIGLSAGAVKFRGLSLGIPGVMFAGLVVAEILGRANLNLQVVAFVRDFGLILFVYAIGVQVGPGFLASLRRHGLPLNAMAVAIVLLGAGLAMVLGRTSGTDVKASVGLFTGATTNAPALGSAEEALKSVHPEKLPGGNVRGGQEAGELLGPAFAISYPFGLLGVILGSIPIGSASLPAPVKLGLASGPMIVAIILARIGRIGPLIWYMPQSASGFLRELGIVMFLMGVGLNGGEGFFAKLHTVQGLYWVGIGAVVTLVPLLLVGSFARGVLRMNYLHICGLLCGSLNSPSLAYTQTLSTSEAPAIAFATVYPLTMISRVLAAQFLILIFAK